MLKHKNCSVDALEVFVRETVIPTGEPIDTLRGNRGTESTSSAFRQFGQDISIRLEAGFANTLQQIGANEITGRTILKIVAVFLRTRHL